MLDTLQWLTEHKPAAEHDLSGLRENFDPRARWRSAINGALAVGRLRRAVSDRSDREKTRHGSQGDVSDAESADEGGWHAPRRSEGSGSNRARGDSPNKSELGQHLVPEAQRRQGIEKLKRELDEGEQKQKRSGEGVNGSSSSEHDDNEYVRVHPPGESEASSTKSGGSGSGASAKSKPSSKHALRREDEMDHSAAHAAPSHVFPDHPSQTEQSEHTNQHRPPPENRTRSAEETTAKRAENERKFSLKMPGTFDEYDFEDSESGHGHGHHAQDQVQGENGQSDGDDGSGGDGGHHHWVGLLQKLGLH